MSVSRPRTFMIVGAVALLALAGCTAGPTDTATTTSTVQTTTLTPVTFPPGANDARVTDANVLLEAHNETLRSLAYEGTLSLAVDDVSTRYTYRGRPDDEVSLWECRGDGCFERFNDSVRIEYQEGHDIYVRTIKLYGGVNNRTHHERAFRESSFEEEHPRLSSVYSAAVLRADQFVLDHVERTANHTFAHYQVANDSQANGSVVVREDGLITDVEYVTDAGFRVNIGVTVRPNLTVEEPWWKAAAEAPIGGDGCGTNDGDPDYDEDNDRDNDGLCDEN